MALNAKQERFCEEYMIDKNATRAYLRAYGCSYDAARVNASKLLTNTNIAQRIEQLREEERQRLHIDRQRILDELAKIAFVNIDDLVDRKTGEIRTNAKRVDLAAVSEISVQKFDKGFFGAQTTVTAKTYSKLDALKTLHNIVGESAGMDVGVRIIDDTDRLDEAELEQLRMNFDISDEDESEGVVQ